MTIQDAHFTKWPAGTKSRLFTAVRKKGWVKTVLETNVALVWLDAQMRHHMLFQVTLPFEWTLAHSALKLALLIGNTFLGRYLDLPVFRQHNGFLHNDVELHIVTLLRRHGFLNFYRRTMTLQMTFQIAVRHTQLRANETLKHGILLMWPAAMLVECFSAVKCLQTDTARLLLRSLHVRVEMSVQWTFYRKFFRTIFHRTGEWLHKNERTKKLLNSCHLSCDEAMAIRFTFSLVCIRMWRIRSDGRRISFGQYRHTYQRTFPSIRCITLRCVTIPLLVWTASFNELWAVFGLL